jgi:flagellin-like protein
MLAATRGVSPVIGTVLLVAIVVILAALAGVAVFAIGDEPQEQTPGVSFDTEFEVVDDLDPHWRVVVEHGGGESLPAEELLVRFVDDSGSQAEVQYPRRFGAGDRFRAGLWGKSDRPSAATCLVEPDSDHPDSDQLDGFKTAGDHATEVDIFLIHEPSNTVLAERNIDLSEEPDRFTGQERHYLVDGSVPSVDCEDVAKPNW